MKHYLYLTCLFVLFITFCSAKNNTSPNISKTNAQFDEAVINDSTVCIFDIPIHLDEEIAIMELSAAGILTYDIRKFEDSNITVIEFTGVEFALNKGFVFMSAKHDKQTIDSLVSKISSYYGEPFIDDEGDPEYNYYHWNLYEVFSDKPYMRIRLLHSDEGGLVMTWKWS